MKVLVVSHYFAGHGGGVEIVAGQLIERLAARGIELRWMASKEAGTVPPCGGIPVAAWNGVERRLGIPYPLWTPGCLPEMIRQIRRADVVHLHDTLYVGNLWAYIAARALRKPVLVTQHVGLVPYRNPILRTLMTGANRLVAAPVLARAAATVAVSTTTRDYFARLSSGSRTSTIIPNGVDLDRFRPALAPQRHRIRADLGVLPGQPVCLFVGRFVEKKGLEVVAALARRLPGVRWLLVGWGAIDPVEWRLPNVTVLGRQTPTAIASLYHAADLLVLPSVGEGFPLVVQESMASGTPVLVSSEIAAACPQARDLMWAAAPDAASFTAALEPILADRDQMAARRTAVATFAAREWNWNTCADLYERMLRQLAGPAAAP